MAETPTTETEINTAAPLLTPQSTHDSLNEGGGARTLTALAIFLGLFAGQDGASVIVRENVEQQMEDWRDNWGYSFPVVCIDTTWNLALVVVSILMLFWTAREQPDVPVRAWICVYALQCAVHVVLVWLEYRRRNRRSATAGSSPSNSYHSSFADSRSSDVMSAAKRWERYNTIIQYLWWLAGVCWLLPNFDMHSAPRLFWLTLTFMAIDVFFAAIGFLEGLIIGFAVCFCLPRIMAFLYFIGVQGGASEADIRVLPKYRYRNDEDPLDVGGRMVIRISPVNMYFNSKMLWNKAAFASMQPSLPCEMHLEMAQDYYHVSTLQPHHLPTCTTLKTHPPQLSFSYR
uniref:Uncharacterized protein n=1 Tax=Lactuca sativa TaxID=4236 RepID=A0A9R1VRZ3_LACSA|nr:hypothetical protein LSAT_V11C400162160 [Lactuca sativa]